MIKLDPRCDGKARTGQESQRHGWDARGAAKATKREDRKRTEKQRLRRESRGVETAGVSHDAPATTERDSMIRAKIETITPDTARRMLAKNTGNRTPKKNAIDRYARDMQNGWWHVTGQPVIIADTGRLLDGQNRLYACIGSHCPFETLVVRGVDESAFYAIDRGFVRTNADVTGWRRDFAQIVSAYIRYIDNDSQRPSCEMLCSVFDASPDAFNMAYRLRPKKARGIKAAPLWACVVLYAQLCGIGKAERFAINIGHVSESYQENMLKDWISRQETFAGGNAQRELVERALFCMRMHSEGKKAVRIERYSVKAFKEYFS